MALALRLAWRDWRGGTGLFRGMGIVLLCLALGVAAIGSIGGLRDAIQQGVAEQRRAILGGDLAIESSELLPPELASFLVGRGARISDTVRLRSMLYASNGRRMLVELSAVDPVYPLVGAATVAGGASLHSVLTPRDGLPGLAAEPLVSDRLGVHPGDIVRVGEQRFRMAPALDALPDAAGSASLAPGAVIARPALDQAGLLRPGALLTASLRVALPDGPPNETGHARLLRARALADAIDTRFANQDWRIRDINDAAPSLTRAVDQVASFMTLIALAALMLGGMGVAAGVARWLETRVKTVAILRSLGGTPRLAGLVVGLQVAFLCGLGILAGMVTGLVLPPIAVRALGGLLPVAPHQGLQWSPVLLASGFGIVVAALFSWRPLSRAVSVPPAVLFRGPAGIAPPDRRRRIATLAAIAGLTALLVLLAVLTSPDRRLAFGFCAVCGAVLAIFRLAGVGLTWLARWLPRPAAGSGVLRVGLRLGLASLGRSAAPATRLLLGFGAGLTVLATIALAEGDLRASLFDQLPRNAPSFYFIDLQPDEMQRFQTLLHAQPTVGEIRTVPSLRTRVVAVNGIAAEDVKATPGTAWALRGDRGLTIADSPPPDTHVVAGHWWKIGYDGPPLISLDVGLARGWNVHVGQTLTLNVLGRDIDFRIASLRDVAWRSLQLNFAFVASPGLLSAAPHTMLATVATSGTAAGDAQVLSAVTDALPNVTGIRVADILDRLGSLVGRLAWALAAIGLVALLSGALVLAATLAAAQQQRVSEAAVLRVLGATSAQLRAAWLVEFAVLGLVAGACAAGIGALLSWLLMRLVLRAPWAFLPGTLAAVAGVAVALMLGAGYVATRRSLSASPALLLRDA